jgi:DNA-binding NarL/FixJ family response regulator
MDKISILLLDDHALFREGLSRLLEGQPDLELAACCASVSEATDVLRRKPIDLVLLDYDLGKERGFEFITQAREWGFKGRFLMVTAGMSDAESVQALDLGVSGIFPKHSSPALLRQAIRKVMAGETWLDENAIQALVRFSKHPGAANQTKPLTERETQVLHRVFEGAQQQGNWRASQYLGVFGEGCASTTLPEDGRENPEPARPDCAGGTECPLEIEL